MEQVIEKKKGFAQVCVWPGTVVGSSEIEKFEKFMLDEFGVRVQYLEEITTKPNSNESNTGGRNDLFFAIHADDVGKFAIPRLQAGIRWIEDVLAPGNYRHQIYPARVFEYKTWEAS